MVSRDKYLTPYVANPRFLHIIYTYYHSIKPEVVPGSDMAGEVVAVGEDVKEWKVGDRVCPNFSPAHIYGDPTPEIQEAALGALVDGVLTEYKAFYPYVRSSLLVLALACSLLTIS